MTRFEPLWTLPIGRQQRLAPLAKMKQDCPALEDREISVGEPWRLAEGLVREMCGRPLAKACALDAIRRPGLLQRPSHAQVPHMAAGISGTQSKVVRVKSAIRYLLFQRHRLHSEGDVVTLTPRRARVRRARAFGERDGRPYGYQPQHCPRPP
jgi:hypothetical protein